MTIPWSVRMSIRSRRHRSGRGTTGHAGGVKDRRDGQAVAVGGAAQLDLREPALHGQAAQDVPSPATGRPADHRGGPVLDHADARPCGKSASTWSARTTGYAPIARSSSAWST